MVQNNKRILPFSGTNIQYYFDKYEFSRQFFRILLGMPI